MAEYNGKNYHSILTVSLSVKRENKLKENNMEMLIWMKDWKNSCTDQPSQPKKLRKKQENQ